MLPDPFSGNAKFCDDDEAVTEAQFRDDDGGFLADVVTTISEKIRWDGVATTL